MEPVNNDPNWNFGSATEALKTLDRPQKIEKALKRISNLGLILATGLFFTGVGVSAPNITATVVLLSTAGAVFVTSLALRALAMIPGKIAKNKEAKLKEVSETADGQTRPGLTTELRAELATGEFKNLLATTDQWSYEATNNAQQNLCKVSTDFTAPRFNPTKQEPAQFAIEDKDLDLKTKNDLLKAAYKKGIILHFNSLETEGLPQDNDAKWPEGIEKQGRASLDLSIGFVQMIKDENMEYNPDKINKQLDALALKQQDGKALTPSYYIQNDDFVLEVGPQLAVDTDYLKETFSKLRGDVLLNWRIPRGNLMTEMGDFDNFTIVNPDNNTMLDPVSRQEAPQPPRWTPTRKERRAEKT